MKKGMKKLQLSRETLSYMNNPNLRVVVGGVTFGTACCTTDPSVCGTNCTSCDLTDSRTACSNCCP
jgi:hypothetical protein